VEMLTGMSPSECGEARSVLNGFIAANVVCALHDLGVLEAVAAGEVIPAGDLPAGGPLLDAVLDAAVSLGLLSRVPGGLALTQLGEEALRYIGYFTVTVRGFGQVLRELPRLVDGSATFGVDVVRDDEWIVRGCSQNYRSQFPILDRYVAALPVPPSLVVDLGCGDATRLLRVVSTVPGCRAVGVDISPVSCRAAEANVRSAGMEDRVGVVHADVRDVLSGRVALPRPDLVMTYFMFHHLIADAEDATTPFSGLGSAFPGASFLIVDGFRGDPAGEAAMFTPAYELFHACAGCALRTRADYEGVIDAAGMTIVRSEPFGHPEEWIYLLRAAL
jgi:methyltransferase family protein